MVVIAIIAAQIAFSILPADAQELFATSVSNYSILRYNGTTGAFVDAFVPPGSGGLVEPRVTAQAKAGMVSLPSKAL